MQIAVVGRHAYAYLYVNCVRRVNFSTSRDVPMDQGCAYPVSNLTSKDCGKISLSNFLKALSLVFIAPMSNILISLF